MGVHIFWLPKLGAAWKKWRGLDIIWFENFKKLTISQQSSRCIAIALFTVVTRNCRRKIIAEHHRRWVITLIGVLTLLGRLMHGCSVPPASVSIKIYFLQRAAAIVARNSFRRQQAALACHFLTRTMLIAMTKDRRGMTRWRMHQKRGSKLVTVIFFCIDDIDFRHHLKTRHWLVLPQTMPFHYSLLYFYYANPLFPPVFIAPNSSTAATNYA